MQIKINIKPGDEEKFIQALNDSNIPYWIEDNEQVEAKKRQIIDAYTAGQKEIIKVALEAFKEIGL